MSQSFLLWAPLVAFLSAVPQGVGDSMDRFAEVEPPRQSLLEPRTPLRQQTTPGDGDSTFRIDQPGSYYLTRNLLGETGKSGIEIASSDVTIDLMGFTLDGQAVGLAGIKTDGDCDRITLRNGIVTDWDQQGIHLASGGEGRILESLQSSSNGYDGILTGNAAIVRDCQVSDNGFNGLFTGLTSSVDRCTARFNGGTGIIGLSGTTLRGCGASENEFGGFYLEQGACLESSVAESNRFGGIFLRDSTQVLDCLSRKNEGDGISASDSAIILRNTVSRNTGNGIVVDGSCLIKDNLVDLNRNENGDAAGILVHYHNCRIEGNHASTNDYGIKVDHTHNLVVKNTAELNATNYYIVPSNRVGVIVSAPGNSSLISGDSGGGLGTSDPWANFAY